MDIKVRLIITGIIIITAIVFYILYRLRKKALEYSDDFDGIEDKLKDNNKKKLPEIFKGFVKK